MAVDVAKRLVGPGLITNAAVTKYTVPAGTTAIVKSIIVCNTSGSAATLTLSIGADAAGTELYTAVSFAPNSTTVIPVWIPMVAAEIIQAFSGTTTVLSLTITGVETS